MSFCRDGHRRELLAHIYSQNTNRRNPTPLGNESSRGNRRQSDRGFLHLLNGSSLSIFGKSLTASIGFVGHENLAN